MILFILVTILVLIVGGFVCFDARNNAVCKERIRIGEYIYSQNKLVTAGVITDPKEIARIRGGWGWFDVVTYDEMLWKFWKPVNSFYKDNEVNNG